VITHNPLHRSGHVIPDVPTHHRLQPLAHFGDGFMHASLKFGFHLVQFRLTFAFTTPRRFNQRTGDIS